MKSVSPMLLISSLLFLMSYHVVIADKSFIINTCKTTPFPNDCISTLSSDPKSFTASDTAKLGLILVNQFSSKAKQGLSTVNSRIKTTKDPKVVQALKKCADEYISINRDDVPVIQQSIFGNPKFAETAANFARFSAEDCEKYFPKGTSMVTSLNTQIAHLAAVVSSIARGRE